MKQVALVALALSLSACAGARSRPTPTRDVWVPRAESHGLKIDASTSRIREIHVQRAEAASTKTPAEDVGPEPASSR